MTLIDIKDIIDKDIHIDLWTDEFVDTYKGIDNIPLKYAYAKIKFSGIEPLDQETIRVYIEV